MPQPVAVLWASLSQNVSLFFGFTFLPQDPWQAPGKIYGRELNETFWRFEVIAEIERQTTGRVTSKLIEGNALWYYRTFAYVA